MQDVIEKEKSQVGTESNLHFKLAAFEGPLDLLLHLIKDHKIDIYDIPIVDITKQYLNYLEMMKELNLEIAGEFLVMAATLVHIKSKLLLPPDPDETEETAEDPRAELVQKLLEYQAFKEASSTLREKELVWKQIFRRTPPQEGDFDIEPDPMLFEATLFDLMSAFRDLLSKTSDEIIEITRETLTVTSRINFILEKLEGADGVKFEELFEENFTKISLIVTFLALLEIIRLGLVKAYQESAFGAIWIINPQDATQGKEMIQEPYA